MNEAEIKLEARLVAIETMLGNLYVNFYKAIRISDEEVADVHAKLLESTRTDTLATPEPALSDLWAGEIHDAFERLITMIEEIRAGPEA